MNKTIEITLPDFVEEDLKLLEGVSVTEYIMAALENQHTIMKRKDEDALSILDEVQTHSTRFRHTTELEAYLGYHKIPYVKERGERKMMWNYTLPLSKEDFEKAIKYGKNYILNDFGYLE